MWVRCPLAQEVRQVLLVDEALELVASCRRRLAGSHGLCAMLLAAPFGRWQNIVLPV